MRVPKKARKRGNLINELRQTLSKREKLISILGGILILKYLSQNEIPGPFNICEKARLWYIILMNKKKIIPKFRVMKQILI